MLSLFYMENGRKTNYAIALSLSVHLYVWDGVCVCVWDGVSVCVCEPCECSLSFYPN